MEYLVKSITSLLDVHFLRQVYVRFEARMLMPGVGVKVKNSAFSRPLSRIFKEMDLFKTASRFQVVMILKILRVHDETVCRIHTLNVRKDIYISSYYELLDIKTIVRVIL